MDQVNLLLINLGLPNMLLEYLKTFGNFVGPTDGVSIDRSYDLRIYNGILDPTDFYLRVYLHKLLFHYIRD